MQLAGIMEPDEREMRWDEILPSNQVATSSSWVAALLMKFASDMNQRRAKNECLPLSGATWALKKKYIYIYLHIYIFQKKKRKERWQRKIDYSTSCVPEPEPAQPGEVERERERETPLILCAQVSGCLLMDAVSSSTVFHLTLLLPLIRRKCTPSGSFSQCLSFSWAAFCFSYTLLSPLLQLLLFASCSCCCWHCIF